MYFDLTRRGSDCGEHVEGAGREGRVGREGRDGGGGEPTRVITSFPLPPPHVKRAASRKLFCYGLLGEAMVLDKVKACRSARLAELACERGQLALTFCH